MRKSSCSSLSLLQRSMHILACTSLHVPCCVYNMSLHFTCVTVAGSKFACSTSQQCTEPWHKLPTRLHVDPRNLHNAALCLCRVLSGIRHHRPAAGPLQAGARHPTHGCPRQLQKQTGRTQCSYRTQQQVTQQARQQQRPWWRRQQQAYITTQAYLSTRQSSPCPGLQPVCIHALTADD